MDRDATSYLAYVKQSRPTGRSLARHLGVTSFGIKEPPFNPDVLIRWGSRKRMPACAYELNRPDAIRLASDKVEAIQVMQNHGVYTVPCFMTFDQARRHKRVILGRNRRGFGGKDIVIYDPWKVSGLPFPTEPSQEHEWYSTYQQPTLEVRLHVVGEKIVRTQGKYCDFPELAQVNPYVRNYAHGYRFRTPDRDIHRRRKAQAIEAVQALGLDFGAVDMLLMGNDRDAMVLEVNTAPSCSPLTMSCYAGEIALLVEQRTGGGVRLAREILEAELADMPEETDDEERYIQ